MRGTRNGNWIHRREDGREIYFVTAHRDAPLQANLDFRATGQPELWDPLTGETRAIPLYHTTEGRTSIPLKLPVAGSAFIVFQKKEASSQLVRIERNGELVIDSTDEQRRDHSPTPSTLGLNPGDPIQPRFEDALPTIDASTRAHELIAWSSGDYTFTRADGSRFKASVELPVPLRLDGPWRLTFPEGWEAPAEVALDRLMPWTDLGDPATGAFSGTARYHTRFFLPALKMNSALVLDLGQVGDIAKVVLNGEEVTTLWAAPYRCDLTEAVKNGENLLTIEVTNTWHNRLAFDAAKPEAERKTWTIFPPQANAPLLPAGLLSDVTLVFGQTIPIAQ